MSRHCVVHFVLYSASSHTVVCSVYSHHTPTRSHTPIHGPWTQWDLKTGSKKLFLGSFIDNSIDFHLWSIQHRTEQYGAVQCSTVQCSEIQCSAVHNVMLISYTASCMDKVLNNAPRTAHRHCAVLYVQCNVQYTVYCICCIFTRKNSEPFQMFREAAVCRTVTLHTAR